LPTIKAYELEKQTIALIPPERIDYIVGMVETVEDDATPYGADLVDVILRENKI
jgi:hypothetical protein